MPFLHTLHHHSTQVTLLTNSTKSLFFQSFKMKFSLFSVAALASSALAFPLVNTVGKDVVPTVEGVVGKVTRGVEVPDVTDIAGLVNTLTVVVSDVKTQTSAISMPIPSSQTIASY